MAAKYYINYSDQSFLAQQKFALRLAKVVGGFDEVFGFLKSDIDEEFYRINKAILDRPKGGGYWLWKPYFILKKLYELEDGDYLFYSDSGAFFLKNINFLILEMTKSNQDIMGFELPLIERQWTKKELFLNMDCKDDFYSDSNQLLASYMLIRKSEFSLFFFEQYLAYACNELNITDKLDPSVEQSKDYIDHRHDQSVFSLLYKKYNLRPFKDPSQFGKYPRGYSANVENNMAPNSLHLLPNGRLFRYFDRSEMYENVLFHHRRTNPLVGFIKYKVKEALYITGLYKGLIS